jgi:hypothetical protein
VSGRTFATSNFKPAYDRAVRCPTASARPAGSPTAIALRPILTDAVALHCLNARALCRLLTP